MSIKIVAEIECDLCETKAPTDVVLEIDRRDLPEFFLKLPDGWMESTWQDTGDKRYFCPTCAEGR